MTLRLQSIKLLTGSLLISAILGWYILKLGLTRTIYKMLRVCGFFRTRRGILHSIPTCRSFVQYSRSQEPTNGKHFGRSDAGVIIAYLALHFATYNLGEFYCAKFSQGASPPKSLCYQPLFLAYQFDAR